MACMSLQLLSSASAQAHTSMGPTAEFLDPARPFPIVNDKTKFPVSFATSRPLNQHWNWPATGRLGCLTKTEGEATKRKSRWWYAWGVPPTHIICARHGIHMCLRRIGLVNSCNNYFLSWRPHTWCGDKRYAGRWNSNNVHVISIHVHSKIKYMRWIHVNCPWDISGPIGRPSNVASTWFPLLPVRTGRLWPINGSHLGPINMLVNEPR